MTFSLSNGAGNAVVDAIVDRLDGGTVKVYSGSKPASPDDAATGTLLATFTLPTPAFGAAATKSATLNTVAATTGVADGTAGWCRFANSSATAQIDGTCGTSGSGAELILSTTAITNGGAVSALTGTISVP